MLKSPLHALPSHDTLCVSAEYDDIRLLFLPQRIVGRLPVAIVIMFDCILNRIVPLPATAA